MNKDHTGALSEAKAVAEILGLGYRVSRPVVDSPYDFIVELESGLTKVQCKTAWVEEYDVGGGTDYIVAELSRRSPTTDGINVGTYSEDEIDSYTIYCDDFDTVYWFEFDELGEKRLRRSENTMPEHEISKKI